MSYGDALQSAAMSAPPRSQGFGDPPDLGPGQPPPPTMMGKMDTGNTSKTKQTAAGDLVASISDFKGFVPEKSAMFDEWISQVKQLMAPKPSDNAGPAKGEPGVPGSAQLDGNPLQDSGSAGPM
jgi:hypothetical protein